MAKRAALISALSIAAAAAFTDTSALAAPMLEEFISGARLCTGGNPCTGTGIRGITYDGDDPDTNYQLAGTVGLRFWAAATPEFSDVKLVISFANSAFNNTDFANGGGLSFHLYETTVNAANVQNVDGVTSTQPQYPWVTDNLPASVVDKGVITSALGGGTEYSGTNANHASIGPLPNGSFGPGPNFFMVLDLGAFNNISDATTCAFNTASATMLTPAGPGCSGNDDFQIKAYDIVFINPVPVDYVVTFNLWGCVPQQNGNDDAQCEAVDQEGKSSKLPGSHVVMWSQLASTDIPEPFTISLLGTALAGLLALRRRR